MNKIANIQYSTCRRVAALGIVLTASALIWCCLPAVSMRTKFGNAERIVVKTPCQETESLEDCLTSGRAAFVVGTERPDLLQWAKLSPDGRWLVVCTEMLKYGLAEEISVFDVTANKWAWRRRMYKDQSIWTDGLFFLGDNQIAFVARQNEPAPLVSDALFKIDLATGETLWSHGLAGDRRKGYLQWVQYDPQGRFFIAAEHNALILIDAATGSEIARTAKPAGPGQEIFLSVGPPLWTDSTLFVYYGGLVAIDRQRRSILWGCPFATYSRDDKSGINTLKMLVSVPLVFLGKSGLSPSLPLYMVGRTTAPRLAGDRIVLGALGIVHCINASDGRLVWSQDLAVSQIEQIEIIDERVVVLAGGSYVAYQSDRSPVVAQSVRSGVYCLNLSDGRPLPTFRSPFNENRTHRSLTPSQVKAFNEDDAFQKENNWLSEAKPFLSGKKTPPRNMGFSYEKLTKMIRTKAGLMIFSTNEFHLLDSETGREIDAFQLPDGGAVVGVSLLGRVVFVRTTSGAVGIDAESGKLIWSRPITPPEEIKGSYRVGGRTPPACFAVVAQARVEAGCVSSLHLLSSRLWREAERDAWGSFAYWADPQSEFVVVTARGPKIVLIRAADGNQVWERPLSPSVFWRRTHPPTVVSDLTARGRYLFMNNFDQGELFFFDYR